MGQENSIQTNNDFLNKTKNDKIKISKSNFEFLYIIGKGGFGKVWNVKHKQTSKQYALKLMSKVKIIDKKSVKNIKSEREFLSKLNHPFLVNMIFSFQDNENLYLVMDLFLGGDLRYHICHKKKFNEIQAKFFCACVILGLEYIHKNNIIHRDIKPENLVLDRKGYLAITDFGIAKKNKSNNSSETSGTPGYMAPEVLCAQNHSFTVDFFALGVICYEFFKGHRPYLGRNRQEIKEAVLAKQAHIHKRELFENGWSLEAGNFINKMIYRKPYKRLGYEGINEIKECDWFQNFNWNELLNKKIISPYIPKFGDNFDKRYCEAKEEVDRETMERYQIYRHKEKYKNIFLNYTFVMQENKNNKNIEKNQNNTSARKSSGNQNKNNKIKEKERESILESNEISEGIKSPIQLYNPIIHKNQIDKFVCKNLKRCQKNFLLGENENKFENDIKIIQMKDYNKLRNSENTNSIKEITKYFQEPIKFENTLIINYYKYV